MATIDNYTQSNPIKEIIISISFAGEVEMDSIHSFIEDSKIVNSFPDRKTDYETNLISQKEIKSSIPDIDIKKSGYILISKGGGDKILHLKIGSLTFHRTSGYESFETLIKELSEYWTIFQSYAGKLFVSDVSLRYLNFVELEDGELPTDLVRVWVTHPFENVVNSFSSVRFQLNYPEFTEGIVVSTLGKDQSKNGIILDVIVRRSNLNQHFAVIEDAYKDMREIKNNIFQKCLSTRAKSKYNL